MNPRRVHSLYLRHCPEVQLVKCEWIHLLTTGSVDRDVLRKMLSTIGAVEVLIHVRRKIGDFLPIEPAITFIGEHIGKGQMLVSDRAFTHFVIVAHNGVAATWPQCLTRSRIELLPDAAE
ncbi:MULTISPECIES: hypothetical protein [Burkholderia]|uniref:Uncharacterized protein n=1 Tax=Burkholderia aenigmatica TaxID=2015348 RepID=A0ABY6XQY6_9BURK|nr:MULTISPECIES: hypothetical protein [Burkholderia]VWC53103.1 hypothetical protein BLA17378_01123 [Burkholderia aenigmatica]VWC71873.1 hypothetical protein BLA18628_00586 [Burkholderia aenigmatica]